MCTLNGACAAQMVLGLGMSRILFGRCDGLCLLSSFTHVQVLQEWASVQDYIQWKVFEWPFYVAQGTSQHTTVHLHCVILASTARIMHPTYRYLI